MKKSILVASFAAVSLSASLAHADGIGVNVGLRTGYAIALGDGSENAPMSDLIKGAIPLHLDATYRITPTINAGLYFGYGLGMKGDKAADGIDSVNTMSYGLQANMLFPSDGIAGWAGVFAGLENVKMSGTTNNFSVTSTTRGWQAGLQGGADWKVAPGFTAGPFASLAFGKYGSMEAEAGDISQSSDIEKTAMHQWLTLGVRGSYGL